MRRRAVVTLLLLLPLGACNVGSSPSGAVETPAPTTTTVASSGAASTSAQSNGREVCTEARAATNSFFADFNGAGAARKAELAEALATQTRARAARATDSDLREQLGRLAELLSSWAHGSAQNAQAYADTLNAACRPWFG